MRAFQSIVFSNTWAANAAFSAPRQTFILERVSASDNDPSQCFYRLGMNGVFSDYLNLEADASVVKTAMLKIPEMFTSDQMRADRLDGTRVTVLSEIISDYRIEFEFVLGSQGQCVCFKVKVKIHVVERL